MHWGEWVRMQASLVDQVGWLAKAQVGNDGPLRKANVHITLCHPRYYDLDNAYSSVKHVLDALKGILIVDDSPRYITLVVDQEIARIAMTRIEVEEVA